MNIHYSFKCPCSDSVNLSPQSKNNTGWWSHSALYIKAPTYHNLVPTTHFDKRSGVSGVCFEDFFKTPGSKVLCACFYVQSVSMESEIAITSLRRRDEEYHGKSLVLCKNLPSTPGWRCRLRRRWGKGGRQRALSTNSKESWQGLWGPGLEITWSAPVTPLFLPGSPPWPLTHGHLRPLPLHPPHHCRLRQKESSGGQGETTRTGWSCCSSEAATSTRSTPPPPVLGPGSPLWGRRQSSKRAGSPACSGPGSVCTGPERQPAMDPPPASGPPSSNGPSATRGEFSQQAPRAAAGQSAPIWSRVVIATLGDCGELCPSLWTSTSAV